MSYHVLFKSGFGMSYRVKREHDWLNELIAFANLKLERSSYENRLVKVFGRFGFENFIDVYPEENRYRLVTVLQSRLKMYLGLIAEPETTGKHVRSPMEFDDVLGALEAFGEENRFSFDIAVLPAAQAASLPYFRNFKPFQWRSKKVVIGRIPSRRSLEEFIYSSLLTAVESGLIWKIVRCPLRSCRKFHLAQRRNRKKYCANECRWMDDNRSERRKIRNKRRQKILKKNKQRQRQMHAD